MVTTGKSSGRSGRRLCQLFGKESSMLENQKTATSKCEMLYSFPSRLNKQFVPCAEVSFDFALDFFQCVLFSCPSSHITGGWCVRCHHDNSLEIVTLLSPNYQHKEQLMLWRNYMTCRDKHVSEKHGIELEKIFKASAYLRRGMPIISCKKTSWREQ